MNKKIFIIVIILIILLIGVLIFSFYNSEEEVVKLENEIVPEKEILDEQLRNTNIELYFIDEISGEIVVENRMIDAKKLLENPYKELIEIWLNGSENQNYRTYLSENININNININQNCVDIDFNEKFIDGYIGKSGDELKVVYCIVNTLTQLTEVNYVRILINGEENQYLGNVNLSEKYCRLEN